MKHTIKDWIIATRPWSFPASAMPVIVTVAWLFGQQVDGSYAGYADTTSDVNWWNGLLALINIVLVHAAGNVWSDYFDYKRKVDRDDTYGVKTLTSGQFTSQQFLRLSVGLQVVAVAMGLWLVWQTGLTLLWIGLAGIALSLCYPPLKYHALGDLVIFLCYAVLPVAGTSFVCTGSIRWEALWMIVPVGLITVGILHANNTRDIPHDRRADITTLAMHAGPKLSGWLYIGEVLLVPYPWAMAYILLGTTASYVCVLLIITLPLAIKNAKLMRQFIRQPEAETIARLDERTAQQQLGFSFVYAALLAISHFFA